MIVGMALNKDNDIFIEGGSFKRSQNGAYLAQKVRSTLNTIQGEIKSNPSFGVPYFSKIFKKPTDLGQILSIIKAKILGVDGIDKLISFTHDLNTETRRLTISFSVNTVYGEIDISDVTISK